MVTSRDAYASKKVKWVKTAPTCVLPGCGSVKASLMRRNGRKMCSSGRKVNRTTWGVDRGGVGVKASRAEERAALECEEYFTREYSVSNAILIHMHRNTILTITQYNTYNYTIKYNTDYKYNIS